MSKQPKKKTKENVPEEGSEDGQSEFAEFVASAMRAPRAGCYEHLLSQFLAQAVICTDPLKRVKVVCEAALMIPETERKEMTVDYEKVEALNAVANALLYASAWKWDPYEGVSIPWGFLPTEENYKRFIEPWFKCNVMFHAMLLNRHVIKGEDRDHRPIVKEVVFNPLWSWFFEASGVLTTEGFNMLKNAFAAWAIPQVQLYLTELTHAVSPGLYAEILGLTRGKKGGYSEKVKETTEALEGPKVLEENRRRLD